MWYLQKHGDNLEIDPPSYGCLHPKWQRQHKDKSLSVEEWSLLWEAEMCAMKPINPKTSHHMTSLDKWTVSAQSAFVVDFKLHTVQVTNTNNQPQHRICMSGVSGRR